MRNQEKTISIRKTPKVFNVDNPKQVYAAWGAELKQVVNSSGVQLYVNPDSHIMHKKLKMTEMRH